MEEKESGYHWDAKNRKRKIMPLSKMRSNNSQTSRHRLPNRYTK
ncbi:hypothetical protein AGMMS4952_27440 [Spirochaetia bacterium]|nr:hypothetical protein AGMMS4952_27440 [Spirochaetia bacterium]